MVVAAAVAAVGSLGLTCGPPPPTSETCELPPVRGDAGELDGALTSLEIGTLDGDGGFAPFVADSVIDLQFGGQGSSMIVAHLRVRGTDVPACLAQRTVLEYPNGDAIYEEQAPVPLDRAADGSWVSGSLFMIFDREPGAKVRLRAEVGGLSRSVEVWTNFMAVDAAPDAAPVDARPVDAAVDAAPDA